MHSVWLKLISLTCCISTRLCKGGAAADPKSADVDAQRRSHENVLQMVPEKFHLKVAQLLVKKGADVNAQGGSYKDGLQMELILKTSTSGIPRAENYITSQ